jgi:hypothetical protein
VNVYAKAINATLFAFVGALGATMTANGGNAPTSNQWIVIAGTTLVTAWTTYQTPNAGTVSTVDVQGIATELGVALNRQHTAPAPVDASVLAAQLTAVHDQLHGDTTPPAEAA